MECLDVKRSVLSEGTCADGYASHANVVLHLIIVLADFQMLVFKGRILEGKSTLSTYEITSESTVYVIPRLRGGGGDWAALAYASVCHDWDGNMASRVFI